MEIYLDTSIGKMQIDGNVNNYKYIYLIRIVYYSLILNRTQNA